jgi:dCTP deaminase
VYSDVDLRRARDLGWLKVEPWDDRLVQPASLDLCLGNRFKVMRPHNLAYIDPAQDQNIELYDNVTASEFFVGPGQFVLASTVEFVALSDKVCARIEGKSSLGRLGLLVHSTAGFIDPGFKGMITLEIANISPLPIKLYEGMPICQLAVDHLDSATGKPYDGKYQGQDGPRGSAYFKNFQPGGFMYHPDCSECDHPAVVHKGSRCYACEEQSKVIIHNLRDGR